MNYSRNTNVRKKSIGRRIMISWLIVGTFCLLLGVGASSLVFHLKDKPQANPTAPTGEVKEILIYGQADGKIFEGDMPQLWETGESFIPLNVPMDQELQEFVYFLCKGYNMDFPFVMALIQHESTFKADVVSATSDYGLMQINEINHAYIKEAIGVQDFLDPYDNVRAGMFILRKLFEKYETPEKVLMAYNLGETGASRLWGQGIYETNYSKEIMEVQQQYKAELERMETK